VPTQYELAEDQAVSVSCGEWPAFPKTSWPVQRVLVDRLSKQPRKVAFHARVIPVRLLLLYASGKCRLPEELMSPSEPVSGET
jgi:hypothetical protein